MEKETEKLAKTLNEGLHLVFVVAWLCVFGPIGWITYLGYIFFYKLPKVASEGPSASVAEVRKRLHDEKFPSTNDGTLTYSIYPTAAGAEMPVNRKRHTCVEMPIISLDDVQ